MFRRTVYAGLPALALLLAMISATMISASQAADSPKADLLTIVPRTALGWGAINHLSSGETKLQKLGDLFGAPQFSLLDMIKDKVGVKKGLDSDGALGVIAMPPKEKTESKIGDKGDPMIVLFVAVTDYDEFLDNFQPDKKGEKISEVEIADRPVVVAHLGGYALFAKRDERKALESVLASKESVAEDARPLAAWLAANDANMAVTPSGVKYLSAQGKGVIKLLRENYAAIGQKAATAIAGLDLYASMLDAAEKNVALGGLGVNVDKAGNVRVAARAKIAAGPLALMLAAVQPGDGHLLDGLPRGDFVIAGGGIADPSLMRSMVEMSFAIAKQTPDLYGISAEKQEKLAKLSMQSFKSLHSMSMVMQTGSGDDPIYSNLYTAMRVDHADRFLADYGKQMEATKELFKDAKDGLMEPPSSKKIEIDGKPALEIEITIPAEKAFGNAMSAKIMQLTYGPNNRATMRLVKGDDKTVYMSVNASNEKFIEAMAAGKNAKKDFASDANVATTVALLPAGAQGIALVSPRGYMQMTQRMIAAMFGGNFPVATVPSFPKTPPIGMSIQGSAGEISAELVFPADMIAAASEYSSTMRRRLSNPEQPPPLQ